MSAAQARNEREVSLKRPEEAAGTAQFRRVLPTRGELLGVVLASLAVAVLASVPYLVGLLAQNADWRFGGAVMLPEDHFSYYAKMNQGRQGYWTFQLPYTAEDHARQPVYLYYLLWGHVARWTGLAVPVLFHLLRLVSIPFFLTVAYLFICQLAPESRTERGFLWLLVTFSSGFGWLMVLINRPLALDITAPEVNTFLTLLGSPHTTFSQGLLLLTWLSFLAPAARGRTPWLPVAAAAVSLGLLAVIQPHLVAIALGTGGLYWLTRWQQGRPDWVLAGRIGAGALVGLPLVGLTQLALNSEALLRGWMAQNVILSPPVWEFLMAYGLLAVAAVFGGFVLARRGQPIDHLLLIWLAITVVGVYAPLDIQRRLAAGLHIVVALLAGMGVYRVWCRQGRAPRTRWIIGGYTGAVSLTTLMVLLGYSAGAALRTDHLFLAASEARALAWIDDHAAPGDVVLSSTELGMFIPAYTDQRAVSGHGFETVNAAATEAAVKRFFARDVTPAEQTARLDVWRVAYVIWGPREDALDGASPRVPGYVLAQQFDEVQVYACPACPR